MITRRLDLLNYGVSFMAKNGVENSKLETEILLAHILDCSRVELYLNNQLVAERDSRNFWQLLSERAKGLPVQYLVGSTEFMGLEFKVAAGVFIPRPETEILVETILQLSAIPPSLKLRRAGSFQLSANILDLGTGCGNIAISLAKHLTGVPIFACDICNSALQLTQENASLNRVKIFLVNSDLFCAFKRNKLFSLIVSNPPYIKAGQIPHLAEEVHFEPNLALDGGQDGLDYYRRIIREAADYLAAGGLLALEIGDGQAEVIKEIFNQTAAFLPVSIFTDYNNRERVIVAQKG